MLYCIHSMANSAFIWHSIIVGGGASGLFCASSYQAPKLLLEHNTRTGVKLCVSGGGKCNFSNKHLSSRDYLSGAKHFCHSALAAWRPEHFIHLLEEEHIAFDELENGQLFAQDARKIAAALHRRALQHNTDIRCRCEVVKAKQENGLFRLETSAGTFYTSHLIIATGGLSYPQLGATGFAFRTAQELGLRCTELRPALVGLRVPLEMRPLCRQLVGSSTAVQITVGKHTETGPLLFTHEGISGPAVLQISLYWQEGQSVQVNFLPEINAVDFLRQHKNSTAYFSKLFAPWLHTKIAKTLLADKDVRAADAKKEILLEATQRLQAFSFVPAATSGYTRSEVTAGGVDCSQFRPGTLECKTIPGLFYIGEALDVTGRLGGYNLHWAWASAAAAARALATR